MNEIPRPIPTRLIEPWILDNKLFISEDLPKRNKVLNSLRSKRPELLDHGIILKAESSDNPVSLAAVDAAKLEVLIGDLVSVLVQSVIIQDDGTCTIGRLIRATGIHGHEMAMIVNPIRVAAECEFLACAKSITIADTSFFSLLYDINLGITLKKNNNNQFLKTAIDRLIADRLFLETIKNPNVIAMSKRGEAHTIDDSVSDREAYGKILDAGEYTKPRSIMRGLELAKGTTGFLDRSAFNDSEAFEIDTIYRKHLGVIYYKPHAWTRAFRVEGHMDILCPDNKLFPILTAIYNHTKIRTITEPWPQFMADFTSRQLSCIAELYGEMNRHRTEIAAAARTKDSR